MHSSLVDSARVLGVSAPATDAAFRGVSTDTRTLAKDNLFVALNGPHYSGADFVSAAREAGAAAAITDQPVDDALPHLVVDDTRDALGTLARDWRRRFSPQVIGITGSNGKTTTRSLIAACCGADTLATQGNLNNDIGVPLTLFRLDASHRRAVIEMGANHQGEIAALAAIAELSGGEYFRAQTTDDLVAVTEAIDRLEANRADGPGALVHRELWVWPAGLAVLVALGLALPGFRR